MYDHTQLRTLRDFLGWSIPEFVEKLKSVKLEVSESTIGNWEAGDTTPDADKLAVIAALFGVGIERFYPNQ